MRQMGIYHIYHDESSYIGGMIVESNKYEAFLIAVEKGSLTAAGETLGYTQSGITRMIRSLEEELGFTLLVRTKNGVRPTSNGQSMMQFFREIIRAHRNAKEAGASICGVLCGELTIGSYYSISAFWLPKILRQFQQQYPCIRIHLREGTNQQISHWLNEKSIDCCLSAKPAEETNCDWQKLAEDELLIWLPPNHPRAKDKSFPDGFTI